MRRRMRRQTGKRSGLGTKEEEEEEEKEEEKKALLLATKSTIILNYISALP